MYGSDEIRTGNMPSLRLTDIVFDSDIEPSKTQQHFAAETDVNVIVKSNAFIPADVSQMRFADVSEVSDYAEALQVVIKAEESFSALDADLRARFANNPENFVNFLSDPQNHDEAIKLGLVNPKTPASSEAEKSLENPSEAV